MVGSTTLNSAKLSAQNLSYEINDSMILQDIDLAVQTGQVLFIEGGNGTGKTTLLRILCGLMQADEGQVEWNGVNIQDKQLEFNQALTFIGHNTGVKAELSTIENIRFFSTLSGQPLADSIDKAIDWAGLQMHTHSPGRYLSYGQQRRVALTRLLLEASTLWVLDEPFSGLDKHMISALQTCFIEHVNRGGMLILTSHQHIELNELNTLRIQLGN